MPIDIAITDEGPEQAGLSEQDILDCFLGTPMQGSYRDYLLNAGRAIEAKVDAHRNACGNCDTPVPPGCGGLFKADGNACALNKAAA